ncbi:hypothetical protein [Phaeocystidibacter marisrubri]|uniref:Uncharacterized protein n=1 Tax=Phaeocystidibacter marisrubri TaxID=1577780 RepID=A0A6L3ZJR3_9FLAO|nr:hypothetical protein [Phaeocystidibacter marisrubri]KAB2818131.1 hypothetical protein F8C82_06940 [Phaeocystidibacter marisrubri]GGH71790.1 hypothetical protein GCM10011318_15110 [Phaeocystidibacter marisrubri]
MGKFTIIKLLVCGLFLFSFYDANAQGRLRAFTAEPQAYFDELTEFMGDMDDVDSDSLELLLNRFKIVWEGFSEGDRASQYDLSNNLLRKRVVHYDAWRKLLKSEIYLAENEEVEDLSQALVYLSNYSKEEGSRFIVALLDNIYIALQPDIVFDNGRFRWEALNGTADFAMVDGMPTMTYQKVDMWGYYRSDSTLVEMTSGVYNIQTNEFKGDGGNVFWTRAGMSADTVYAELSTYAISMDNAGFKADSVTLHSVLFIKEPLLGYYEERLTSNPNEVNAVFPRFVAYDRVDIKDFLPGVDYEGGFSMVGRNFYASDELPSRAVMKFRHENDYQVVLKAERFLLRDDLVRSEACNVYIKLGEKDSLYHPKSTMQYLPEQVKLTLTRNDEGLSMTPYTDSYHDMDIFPDQITWRMNTPQMFIQNLNLGSTTPVVFESKNYFRGERFSALAGLDRVNPLYRLRDVAVARDTADQSLESVARYLRMDELHAERFLMLMSIQNFINYDIINKTVSFNDKLFDYILDYEGYRDYDVIRFVSGVSRGANASISLLNYDMDIVGINSIALSDSQEVALFPTEHKITVHEGMDFDFDGKIQAGRFSFWGKGHFFDYDMFRISMPDIDSMRFKVEEFDDGTRLPGTRPKLVSVKNTLQDINGELLIDRPNNKSGKVSYTEYPIFKSATESYVYYDNQSIYEGVYDRERFFVELEPFEIDSLDNTSTEGLTFDGVFVSAGIFPDMPQTVMVQEDYSLGFKTTTPPTGLPAYGGKGKFYNDLQLSNEGLVGTGQIEYITSTAVGDAFTFFPDSTNGIASSYVIEERSTGTVQYPPADGQNVFINWRPYDDVMYAKSRSTPFNMYGPIGMKAEGTLAYGASDLRGDAKLEFLDAQTISKDFVFSNRSFDAQSTSFAVKKDPTSDWAFKLWDANGYVDFDKQYGEFTLNGGTQYMEFTMNKYITWMDHAEWNIPVKTIEVSHESGQLSRMVGTARRLDSLEFMAMSAKFALEPSLLEAFEVPEIDVADSRIFPDSGYVAIDPNAYMRELTNARLTANRYLKYHNFYNGTFKIDTRHKYSGSADYEYLDKDGTAWPLFFEEIKVDTSETTIGLAKVKKEDEFYLSPFFGYYGKVRLRAPERLMTYDGHLLIQHTCENLETDWFKFESEIDPNDIVVDLPEDNPTTRGDDIYNGIYLAPDSTSIYTGFLNNDASKVDKELISATGVLFYDETLNSYIITTRRKLRDESIPDNYVSFNNRDCIMTGKGKISLAQNTGRVEVESYGVAVHDLRNDELQVDVTMTWNFLFSEDLMNAFAMEINAESGLAASSLDGEGYNIAMQNIITDKEDRQEYFADIANYGAPEEVPKPLRRTIVFTDITLLWSEERSSFVSDGNLGIGNFGEAQVNKSVEGIMEIMPRRRSDELFLYLEPTRDYFFFQYRRNIMQFYSTNEEITAMVLLVEADERALEAEGGKPRYAYNQTSRGRVSLFLRRHDRE